MLLILGLAATFETPDELPVPAGPWLPTTPDAEAAPGLNSNISKSAPIIDKPSRTITIPPTPHPTNIDPQSVKIKSRGSSGKHTQNIEMPQIRHSLLRIPHMRGQDACDDYSITASPSS
jgi:hypothetical protein